MFGGFWTQQKLRVLTAYLRQYRNIFQKNARGQFFEISYVDAFAGTGVIPQEEPRFYQFFETPQEVREEIRKGSVRRALEIDPPFHHYVFIEKNSKKCVELERFIREFPDRDIRVINGDANHALLEWCKGMNTKRERAVVFLDPFGASVDWKVVEALANTKAVDMWILFPISGINRMLNNRRKPGEAMAQRLTKVFGSDHWEREFYSSLRFASLIDPSKVVEKVHKSVTQTQIIEFFKTQLGKTFVAVSDAGCLRNTRGRLLFVLFFAAGNQKGAGPGLRIANNLVTKLNQLTV